MTRGRLGAGVLTACISAATAAAQDGVLMRAMRDELDRTMAELKLPDLEGPYFVSYTVRELSGAQASASLGAAAGSGKTSARLLSVELRVGNPELDNTNFYSRQPIRGVGGMGYGRFPVSIPLEDEYRELRRAIWLATDAAYKQALGQFARKQAALQNETRVDEIPDFSPSEPFEHRADGHLDPPSVERIEALARKVSAAFNGLPHVYASEVRVDQNDEVIWYVNSEGSWYRKHEPRVSVRVMAGTQAEDGTPIEDTFTVHARTVAGLPTEDQLAGRAKALAGRLAALNSAGSLERYSGPVLFEGQAAAAMVRRVLAPKLVAARVPVADDPRFSRMVQQVASPFVDKLGSRVLPRFMAVVDDPSAVAHGDVPLLGGYQVDDEAVPSRRTELVRRGLLRTLLSTRTPVPGVPTSSGSRRGGGPAPSNLFLIAEPGLTPEDLRAELLSLVEERELEFGIVVRRFASGGGRIARGRAGGGPSGGGDSRRIGGVVAYKVFADGSEELLRPMELTGFSETDFRDVVAASADSTVQTGVFVDPSGAFDRFGARRPALVTVVVPSLLFEDATIRRPPGNIPRPPDVPHPLAAH